MIFSDHYECNLINEYESSDEESQISNEESFLLELIPRDDHSDSKSKDESRTERDPSCYLMLDDRISDDDESLPDLVELCDSESEDKSEEDDMYLLQNRRSVIKKEKPTKKTTASVIFSLEDKNGNTMEYLGLLDTGSTSGLINKVLVENGFQLKKSTSIWDTNAGNFKTGERTNIKGLRFPQFTNKRKRDKTSLYVNPNGK